MYFKSFEDSDFEIEPLSFEHKPEVESERKRIEKSLHKVINKQGVFRIINEKIRGSINISRTIGDFKFK